ncbi:hypothetical protein FRB91_004616 [Serendipita sp. 411]|nr:hypothetical protein FRB91_004616 [Serendipita sp. 411]
MSTGSKLFKSWIKGTPTYQSAGSPSTPTTYHGPFCSSGTQLPSSLPKQVTIAATNNPNMNTKHPGVLGEQRINNTILPEMIHQANQVVCTGGDSGRMHLQLTTTIRP